jgi:hypothetical protein
MMLEEKLEQMPHLRRERGEYRLNDEVSPEIQHLRYLINEKTQEIRDLRNENESFRMLHTQKGQFQSSNLPPKFDDMFARSGDFEINHKAQSQSTQELIEYFKTQHKNQEEELIRLRFEKDKDRSKIEHFELESTTQSENIRDLKLKLQKAEFEITKRNTEIQFFKQQEEMLKIQATTQQVSKIERIYEPVREFVYQTDPEVLEKNDELGVSLRNALDEEKKTKLKLQELERKNRKLESELQEKNAKVNQENDEDTKKKLNYQGLVASMQSRSKNIVKGLVFKALQQNADSCRLLRNLKKKSESNLKRRQGHGFSQARGD